MAPRIIALCLSTRKGIPKTPVDRAELLPDHGLTGDAHAGPWHRQVSLLATESIARVRRIIPDLAHGAFAENIVTEGIDLKSLPVGTRLQLGCALLEVTQIGKECHNDCAIKEATGDCVMPREGIFCRVLEGGVIRVGDAIAAEGPSLREFTSEQG